MKSAISGMASRPTSGWLIASIMPSGVSPLGVPALKNPESFLKVDLDDYPTLSWNGLAQIQDYDGKLIEAPLDFCPDMLWEISSDVN